MVRRCSRRAESDTSTGVLVCLTLPTVKTVDQERLRLFKPPTCVSLLSLSSLVETTVDREAPYLNVRQKHAICFVSSLSLFLRRVMCLYWVFAYTSARLFC